MNKDLIIYNDKHYLSFSRLNEEGIVNAFSLKPYNFRKQFVPDNKIVENYAELQSTLNYHFSKIVKPNQTHTNIVKKVDNFNINDEFNDVDGLITDIKNVALVTSVADCQAILLYDNKKKVIGNVHSGWNGTLNRITQNAIHLMIQEYNFEVDSDVKNMFQENFMDIDINSCITMGDIKENKQKYFIDTVSINKQILLNMGLKEDNIILSNLCSKCNHQIIHSHRSDGIDSGRNIAIIGLK